MRVALWSEFEILAAGLRVIFASGAAGMEVVGPAAGDTLTTQVDVIVGAPAFCGASEVEIAPIPKVVVVSPFVDHASIARAIDEGCRGYLWCGLSELELVEAVRRVAGGEFVVRDSTPREETRGRGHGELRGAVRDQGRVSRDADLARLMSGTGLTPREAGVLMGVAEGFTNQQIAAHLQLSVNTVKTYLRSAYAKMEFRRRSQALLWTHDRIARGQAETSPRREPSAS